MSFDSKKETNSSVREGRYPTGIKLLDEDIMRGIPQGSTIAVVGGAEGASELILHSLAATGRKTEYITTLRSDRGLDKDIKGVRNEEKVSEEDIDENLTIRDVVSSTDSIGDVIRKSTSSVDDGNLIIDSFSKFKDDPQKLLDYARTIHINTRKNKGISYLYFATEYESLTRQEKEVLQLVDGVFNVETEISGDSIENNLFINKLRGMKLPHEGQNLVFGKKLVIDSTSDIG